MALRSLLLALMVLVLGIFTGCGENYGNLKFKEGNYKTGECQQELSAGKHYHEIKGIDRIVVEKKNRKMYLYKGDKVVETFRISLGKNPDGTKLKQGDFRTPIGTYQITLKKCHPKYYRMINISYPNSADIAAARARGDNPGSGITIHAQPFWNDDGKGNNYTLSKDWTNGCVAVTNEAMDTLWYTVKSGTPIEIKA